MDWTKTALAIEAELDQRRYELAAMPTFNLLETLTACLDEATFNQVKTAPLGYLTAIYPLETQYGPRLPLLRAFDDLFSSTWVQQTGIDAETGVDAGFH